MQSTVRYCRMGQDRLNGRCRGDVNLNQPAHLMDIALLWLGLSATAAVTAATVRLLLLYMPGDYSRRASWQGRD